MPALYEQDFFAWTEDQAARLRHGPRNDLDWQNLAEEIEDLGREQRNACKSLLRQILAHLLKIAVLGGRDTLHWRGEVAAFRDSLADRLTPAIRHHVEAELPALYTQSRRRLMLEWPEADWPEACPWTLDAVISQSMLPDPPDTTAGPA